MCKTDKETLLKTIIEAKEVPIEGVSGVADFLQEFKDHLKNGMGKGFGTGIKSFDF